MPQRIARDPNIDGWQLVVIHDDAKVARSPADFLWATWTRFDPASDIYARSVTIRRNHPVYEGAIVIDARMKPSYPAELFVRDDIGQLALWAFWIEPRRLILNHATLDLPRWSPALDGLRVMHMTDLHIGSPHTGLERLDEVVRLTNAQQPDAVVITGDFLIDDVIGGAYVPPAPIAERVAALRARHGVFVVLGNHDWWNEGEELKRLLEAAGVRVLEDAAAEINHNGARLWMVGVGDLWTRRPDIGKALRSVPESEPKIVFTHNPDLLPRVPVHVSLTLAGHTHGGQVWLPILGRLVVPSQHGARYAAGHITENGKHLFVSTGIGTSIAPVRFGVTPEIAVLTLHNGKSE